MGVDATISLSLIFSSISMLGVMANIFISIKRESDSSKAKEIQIEKHFAQIDVKLEDFLNRMSQIAKSSEQSANKIDSNLQEIIKSNERIGTLFRLHDEHEKRINALEERAERNNSNARVTEKRKK